MKPRSELHNTDCLEWMASQKPNSVHAIVTDPPYGFREFTDIEKEKLRKGRGGVWRIPPSFDGCVRSPVPRFTVLTDKDKAALTTFFTEFSKQAFHVLVPGGHIFIAANPLLSHLIYMPLLQAGFEKRGEVIRLVQTLRGGDRPKNAHDEFDDVTVMPRSAWEPWGLFRKPCEGRVQDNLRKWKAGALRRVSADLPFTDVIQSAPTRPEERAISPHPSLKPQAFMRQIVRASLPLGQGIVLDPFAGGGSTLAAAIAVGYESVGIELDPVYYEATKEAIPMLAAFAKGAAVATEAANGSDVQPFGHQILRPVEHVLCMESQRDRGVSRRHEGSPGGPFGTNRDNEGTRPRPHGGDVMAEMIGVVSDDDLEPLRALARGCPYAGAACRAIQMQPAAVGRFLVETIAALDAAKPPPPGDRGRGER
jgi:DNA modification methylase